MTPQIEIHTLAGAYALDALSEFERASFDRHIAGCSACSTEVAELREAASRLGSAAWETPPPAMRANVMSAITQTRQIGPGRATTPEPRRADETRRWRRWTAASAAAAVLAVGGGITTWYVADQRVRDAGQIALREEQIAGVLTAPDARVEVQDVGGGARVTMIVAPSKDQGVAVMSNLDEPPPGMVYQLWVMTGNAAVPSAVLNPGQRSGTELISGIRGADQLGVTREPEGGSTRPSEEPIIKVPLI